MVYRLQNVWSSPKIHSPFERTSNGGSIPDVKAAWGWSWPISSIQNEEYLPRDFMAWTRTNIHILCVPYLATSQALRGKPTNALVILYDVVWSINNVYNYKRICWFSWQILYNLLYIYIHKYTYIHIKIKRVYVDFFWRQFSVFA